MKASENLTKTYKDERKKMLLAHKVEIRPTKLQAQYLVQAIGASRYAYNALVYDYNQTNKTFSKKKSIAIIQHIRANKDWTSILSSRIMRSTVEDMEDSVKKAWSPEIMKERAKAVKLAKTPKQKAKAYNYGFPSFKRKGEGGSFSIREKEKIKMQDDRKKFKFEKFPKELGMIRMREFLRFKGVIKELTISYRAGKWFASFLVDTTIEERKPNSFKVGVDMGVKTLATLSDGKKFEAHKSLGRKLRKLKTLDKKLKRQVRGGKNYVKTKLKRQKLYYYVSERRQAYLHELTSYLAKNYKIIHIEDLDVNQMLKTKNLSRAISDVGFGYFKTQMGQKCKMYNSKLVLVDQYFPSSKKCSSCGFVKSTLSLSTRWYICDNCGLEIDRDENASLNIKNWKPKTNEKAI
jgi:putative transposase